MDLETDYDGITKINVVDWLLDKNIDKIMIFLIN